MKKVCDKCKERPAMHKISCKEGWKHLCCKCHIEEGGIPADWHTGCMYFWRKNDEKILA